MRRSREGQLLQRMSEKDLYQTPQVDVPWMTMPPWVTFGSKRGKVEGSQGKDPRTFKGPVERWRSSEEAKGEEVEEKEEEKDKKKKVKYRRSSLWKKAKGLCVNAAAEGLQKGMEMMERWQQQEVRVKESRWAQEISQRWQQPRGEDRTK